MKVLKPLVQITMYTVLLLQESAAQKVAYSNAELGHEIKIAGQCGNNIHVWSSSVSQPVYYVRTASLTLHVLSKDLQLITEKKIELGNARSWDISFRFEDSIYYANIVLFTKLNDRLLLKIDAAGNITDVTDHMAAWSSPQVPKFATRFYALTQNDNAAFAIRIEPFNTGKANNTTVVLPSEKYDEYEISDQVIIVKRNLANQQMAQRVFAFFGASLSYPLIKSNDSAVLVCAFVEQEKGLFTAKNDHRPFLFFAQLDTNLSSKSAAVVLKSNRHYKQETFLPRLIYPYNNGYCIISNGQHQLTDYYNWPSSSLRFTFTDNNNQLIKDTVIEDKPNKQRFQWENFFVSSSGNTLDFFCARPSNPENSGIIHLSIDKDGNMSEHDMLVKGEYQYMMPLSKSIGEKKLLIPFMHNGKTSLMKLDYNYQNDPIK
jgi:hypothetical protein